MCFAVMLAMVGFGSAWADKYADTIDIYRKSEAVQPFFKSACGYAVFPTIGKGGLGIGGAYGKSRVYQGGKVTGEASPVQLSIGWQAGGQAFSQMIFFEDKRAYEEFTSGNFEFDASASAVAITAGGAGQGRYRWGYGRRQRRAGYGQAGQGQLPQGHGPIRPHKGG
jgi:hypothetical protein